MNDDVAALLLSVIAEVDQMGAELNDPETPPERKEEIRRQLSLLYRGLTKYVDK